MSVLEKIRVSQITCSDRRMDILDNETMLDSPVNRYNIRCNHCRFPDIDSLPNPYFIAKGRVFSGIEIHEADLGNLFISDRLKNIFEILLPNDCSFTRTFIEGSKTETKWWLAIPTRVLISGEVNETVQRCPECNEPLHAHPGSQYNFWLRDTEASQDIVKSKNWHSIDEKDWKVSWLLRDVFLSLRLISLLKKIKAKGVYQVLGSKNKTLNRSEKEWIDLSLIKIGDLANSLKRKDIDDNDIKALMRRLDVDYLDDTKATYFENKFKRKTTRLINVLCNLHEGFLLEIDGEKFEVEAISKWEAIKGRQKLIRFAFDKFGDSLEFDPRDQFCPIYYYDHETMISEQIKSSILDFIK